MPFANITVWLNARNKKERKNKEIQTLGKSLNHTKYVLCMSVNHNNAYIKIRATQSMENMTYYSTDLAFLLQKMVYNNLRLGGWRRIFNLFSLLFPFFSYLLFCCWCCCYCCSTLTPYRQCVWYMAYVHRVEYTKKPLFLFTHLPAWLSVMSGASSVNHILITVLFNVYSRCLRSIHIDALQ